MDYSDLERLVSARRLERYLAEANGDRALAVSLYEWNLSFSGSVLGACAVVEVVLRNAVNNHLAAYHETLHPAVTLRWYDQPNWFKGSSSKGFTVEHRRNLNDAMRRASDQGPASRATRPDSGRVVAELTFGFWRNLFTKHYEHTLWYPALRLAFPGLPISGKPGLDAVADRLDGLHLFRNRAAHHEPIFAPVARGGSRLSFAPADIPQAAAELLGWIDPAAHAWFASSETMSSMLAAKP